jgi:hypothetical protein
MGKFMRQTLKNTYAVARPAYMTKPLFPGRNPLGSRDGPNARPSMRETTIGWELEVEGNRQNVELAAQHLRPRRLQVTAEIEASNIFLSCREEYKLTRYVAHIAILHVQNQHLESTHQDIFGA